jgi:hypothetical protein
MLEYLITQAESSTYNKGWKNKVKLYEEIAGDPEMIIIGAEMLCKIDEERGSLVEGSEFTLRETIDAVSAALRLVTSTGLMLVNRWNGTWTTSTRTSATCMRSTRVRCIGLLPCSIGVHEL